MLSLEDLIRLRALFHLFDLDSTLEATWLEELIDFEAERLEPLRIEIPSADTTV